MPSIMPLHGINCRLLILSGLLTETEEVMLSQTPSPHSKYWVPCCWASHLAALAREEGRLNDELHLKCLLDEIQKFRGDCGMLFNYDYISVPIVYTQVTTLATYTFFVASVMGSQFLDPDKGYAGKNSDLYVPIFSLLQFFFYMGWLKVAEQLINPFGEDDDDFDINWIIDRNMQVGLIAVDELCGVSPPLEKDKFWDDVEVELPYTKSTINYRTDTFMGSTADLSPTRDDMHVVSHLDTIPEKCSFSSSPNMNFTGSSPSRRYIPGSPSTHITSSESLDRATRHHDKNLLQTVLKSNILSDFHLPAKHIPSPRAKNLDIGFPGSIVPQRQLSKFSNNPSENSSLIFTPGEEESFDGTSNWESSMASNMNWDMEKFAEHLDKQIEGTNNRPEGTGSLETIASDESNLSKPPSVKNLDNLDTLHDIPEVVIHQPTSETKMMNDSPSHESSSSSSSVASSEDCLYDQHDSTKNLLEDE